MPDRGADRLSAVAAHGYAGGRVAVESGEGQGLIGVAARRRRTVRITNMARSRSMAGAVSAGDEAPPHDVPMPGVAGRILFRLVSEHLSSGRTQFSNKELRLDRTLGRPAMTTWRPGWPRSAAAWPSGPPQSPSNVRDVAASN